MWIVHLGQTLEDLLRVLWAINSNLNRIANHFEPTETSDKPLPKEQVRMGRRQSWSSKRARLEAKKQREVNEDVIATKTD